jgi:hypothetical protein
MRLALASAAADHLPHQCRRRIGGPSNIGNYLAKIGIDATAGVGVAY